MIQHNNIDRNDAAINTKAPFEWTCPLSLNGAVLPSGAFLSIRVYLSDGMIPPARIYRVTNTGVTFCDSTGAVIGTWRLYAGSASDMINGFIRNDNNVITGFVCTYSNIPAFFRAAASKAGGEYYTDNNDFILLPDCCSMQFSGCCRSLKQGNTIHTSNVCISASEGIQIDGDAANGIQVSLYGTYTPLTSDNNTICKLSIRHNKTDNDSDIYWVGGRHLLQKAGTTSNLRVVQNAADVTLKGVLDD